ncbi:MAG TPA: hypothetical protein PKL57_17850, partial [Candidatus Wallbacteria bacterium]|nr:hypothetical protein [Candidatus Wallbacteria bacterium]
MIFGEKEFNKIYDYIKSNSKFDKFDVLINAFDSKLTRFANSIIHQNVAEKNFSVLLRGVKNNRVGVASVNSNDSAKLGALIKNV